MQETDQERTLQLNINPTLFQELELAARECEITPQRFASEAIEAVIAERRLDRSDRLKILRQDGLGTAAEPSVEL